MTKTLPKICSFGGSNTGLATVGVTVLDPDGTTHTARTTADIFEIGGGIYGKEITFEDNWSGLIKWDTGGASPVYAVEEYNIEGIIDAIEEDTSELQGLISASKIAAQVKGMDTSVLTAAAIAADTIGASEFTQAAADKIWDTAAKALTTPADYKADISALALEATLTAIKGSGWSDETLKAIMDALEAEVGPGALSCTWTQNDDGEDPMDNVQIWITTDEDGANVIAGTLLTDSSGEATFMLDAGTYYVWREKGGYNFTNPQTWTVS